MHMHTSPIPNKIERIPSACILFRICRARSADIIADWAVECIDSLCRLSLATLAPDGALLARRNGRKEGCAHRVP